MITRLHASPAPGAASGKFAVHHYGRQTAHTVLFSPFSHVLLMHVVDVELVFRACNLFDQFDDLLAGHTPRAENLDFMFL